MKERTRILTLVLIMIVVAFVGVVVSITILYQTAIKEEGERLRETAKSQARLLEAVARFDAEYSVDYVGGSFEATLSQIREAHENYEGFGETGEFTLAQREGDQIVFLLSHRHGGLEEPTPILFDSTFAEPQRRALSGQSGVVIGLDYRGEVVLAAYEPVEELDLGIVAKIDLAEIQAPFIDAGIKAGIIALGLVLLGSILSVRISNPVIRQLTQHAKIVQEREAGLAKAQAVANMGSWSWHVPSNKLEWSEQMYRLFGIEKDKFRGDLSEVIGTAIHPDDRPAVEQANLSVINNSKPIPLEYRVVWPDGTVRILWAEAGEITLDKSGAPILLTGVVQDITERKQVEEALRESEALHRALIEGIPDLIFLLDKEGNYLNVFSNSEFLLLEKPENYIGKNIMAVLPEEIASLIVKTLDAVATTGVPQMLHYVLDFKDKEYAIEDRIIPLNENAAIRILRDITERKQAEEKLLDSENMLKLALKSARSGAWKWNIKTNENIWSEENYLVLGLPPGDGQATYNDWFECIHKDDQEMLAHVIAEAIENHADLEFDYRVVWPDGSIRWLHEYGKLSMDESGNPAFMHGINIDITERKQTEEALEKSESKLMEAQQIALLGYWELDLVANTLFWSDEIYRIFNLEPQEFGATYEAFLEAVHPDEREFVDQAYINSVKDRTPYDIVHRLLLKDGTIKYVNEKCQTVYDEDGNPLSSLGTVQDITELKQVEESLRRHSQRLEIITQVDQAILEAQSLQEIFAAVVENIKNIFHCRVGAVALIDFEKGSVEVVTTDDFEDGSLDGIDRRYDLGVLSHSLEVLKEGREFYVEDLREVKLKGKGISKMKQLKLRSFVEIPLMVQGVLFGGLGLYSDEPNAFDSTYLEMARTISDTLSLAIQHTWLFDEEQERRREAETLREATASLVASLEVDNVFEILLKQFEKVIQFDGAAIYLLEEDKWKFKLGIGPYFGNLGLGQDYQLEDDSKGNLILDSKQYLIDYKASQAINRVGIEKNINTWMGVPMIVKNEVVGMLAFDSYEVNAYHKKNALLAQDIANQGAVALENARLYEQLRQSTKEYEALEKISNSLRRAKFLEELVVILLAELENWFVADGGAVFVPVENGFAYTYFSGVDGVENYVPESKEVEDELLGIIEAGQPVFVSDPLLEHEKFETVAVLPFKTSKVHMGGIVLYWISSKEASKEDRRFLKMITEMAVVAVGRLQLRGTLEEQVLNRTRELSTLYELAEVSASSTDLSRMLADTLAKMLESTFGMSGAIYLYNEKVDSLELEVFAGMGEVFAKNLVAFLSLDDWWNQVDELNEGITAKKSLGAREMIEFGDVEEVSCTLSPVYIDGKAVGVISLFYEGDYFPSQEELNFVRLVADQIGVSIERAYLREKSEHAVLIEERNRLAGNLHDSVTQSLYSVALLSKASQNLAVMKQWDDLEDQLETIREVTEQALKEMRLLVYELLPDSFEEYDLIELLENRISSVENRSGISAQLFVEGDMGLSSKEQLDVYRIIQEALNNSLKHSLGDSINIFIRCNKDEYIFEVIDNGQGFDIDKVNKGIGLNSMQERANHLDGKLSILSEYGEGTTVKFSYGRREYIGTN